MFPQYNQEITRNRSIRKLEAHESKTASRWSEAAEYRQANKSWLRHSQRIAMLMLDKMDELHLTQTELAQRMGCSQQYVSKILRGKENLSIETLCKIEDALSPHLLPSEVETV